MKGYGQFCPVAKGAEIFNERWTPLIIREMLSGSKRFNDIKRGNPMMSPSILSQRLKSLEDSGVIEKHLSQDESPEYALTEAGQDLGKLVVRLGLWGIKWGRSRLKDDDYDPNLLMWDIRRTIDVSGFPKRRVVISFLFRDMPTSKRNYWLIVEDGEVDLCVKYPGFEVDLAFLTTARVMADIWMGYSKMKTAIRNKSLILQGMTGLKKNIDDWFHYNLFANPDLVAEKIAE